jgi:hypothetical protein
MNERWSKELAHARNHDSEIRPFTATTMPCQRKLLTKSSCIGYSLNERGSHYRPHCHWHWRWSKRQLIRCRCAMQKQTRAASSLTPSTPPFHAALEFELDSVEGNFKTTYEKMRSRDINIHMQNSSFLIKITIILTRGPPLWGYFRTNNRVPSSRAYDC